MDELTAVRQECANWRPPDKVRTTEQGIEEHYKYVQRQQPALNSIPFPVHEEVVSNFRHCEQIIQKHQATLNTPQRDVISPARHAEVALRLQTCELHLDSSRVEQVEGARTFESHMVELKAGHDESNEVTRRQVERFNEDMQKHA